MMLTGKKLAPDELSDAKRLVKILEELTPEKRRLVTMIANAFITGMEAREQVERSVRAS